MTETLSKQPNALLAKEENQINWKEVLEKFKTTFGKWISFRLSKLVEMSLKTLKF